MVGLVMSCNHALYATRLVKYFFIFVLVPFSLYTMQDDGSRYGYQGQAEKKSKDGFSIHILSVLFLLVGYGLFSIF